jgi:hypothetical protein
MEHRTDEEVSQLVEVRLIRQAALTSRTGMAPLRLVAVTHESTLRQLIGSPEIMRAQLDALASAPDQPDVRLHVLPFTAPPVFSMTCMYAHFEYQDIDGLDQDIVHIETHAGFLIIDDSAQVARYRAAHDALVAASLSPADSRSLIRTTRHDLYGG